jgi:methionyl-tRNA formyltransferase
MQLLPSETKEWALAHELPVLTPDKLDADTIEKILATGAEYALVVAYGKILPRKLINAFPKGVLNVHYSLLPKYRGASPVEAALLAGEEITGVSIQKMVFELDAGDVIASKEVVIEPAETTRELRPRLVTIGAELLADILPNFEHGMLAGVPQDASAATHSGKISKEEGRLNLDDDATANWNKYRAYAESPGTYFFANKNGKEMRVKIITAELRDGAFVPLRVVPEGKKEMNYADFARG